MEAESLDFGVMHDDSTLMSMFGVTATPQANIKLCQDMKHREVKIEFGMAFPDRSAPLELLQSLGQGSSYPMKWQTYQIRISMKQLKKIHQLQHPENQLTLLFSLDTPPQWFRKLDDSKTHRDDLSRWTQSESWYRQTDISDATQSLQGGLTLKSNSVIDLGR